MSLRLEASSCQPDWVPTFGALPGVDGVFKIVRAQVTYDDGSGAALYVGGGFDVAAGVPVQNIAKWDGSSWTALPGTSGGSNGGAVSALAVFDDGGGPALYAGGLFTSAGGVAANRIAKWDGSSWSALGTGISAEVRVIAGFDDGSGPALYAGGSFTTAGGVTAQGIARWNGSSWSALGTGLSSNGAVAAMSVFDDGSGPALYVAGQFSSAGGIARTASRGGTGRAGRRSEQSPAR